MDKLKGASVFSTLDLKDGFFHVPVHKDSVKYTAFIVKDGQYEFLKVPFGFCNSPAVFQRDMQAKLRKLTEEGIVLIYLDDLIIPSKNEKEGLARLRRVLDTASNYGMIINWKKCNFLVRNR